jgi:hypothetical protein
MRGQRAEVARDQAFLAGQLCCRRQPRAGENAIVAPNRPLGAYDPGTICAA